VLLPVTLILPLPAATKNCTQAYTGYHFFGVGFYTDSVTDQIGPDYSSGSAADAAACALWCQEDSQCIKWWFHAPDNGCLRLSSHYTGTVMDANYTSGICYGSSKSGKQVQCAAQRLCTCTAEQLCLLRAGSSSRAWKAMPPSCWNCIECNLQQCNSAHFIS
jgi:hypothetical protein